jgi:dethiobiotin synthetase
MIRIGITGTDTGVGKTVVAQALAAGFRRRELRVVAMKPIETGVSFDSPERDGALLARAAGASRPLSLVAPITLAQPLAPLVAARESGMTIDIAALDASVSEASEGADALVVEGAGGLLVPVADGVSFDGLFARWSLDLVIVASNRLGVVNHTRLTIAAARTAGLRIRCVVLNNLTPQPLDTSVAGNGRLIAELENVAVIELAWLANPRDLTYAATQAEECGLISLLLSA